MSLAINAAPFESDQNTNNNSNDNNNSHNSHNKGKSLNGSQLSSKLKQYLSNTNKMSKNKTQKNSYKEGFDFKMDKDKMKAMLKNVENMVTNDDNYSDNDSDDETSIGDYNSNSNTNNQLLPPPQSAGTEKTKLLDKKEGFEPLALNQEDTQLELNDYSNYGNDNDNEEYYRRVVPGYSGTGQQQQHSNPLGNHNDVLLKKINYMIQLLEDQHDEKTNNVTEEVVLYSFLGVFMIFIVDSFAKVGKYVR